MIRPPKSVFTVAGIVVIATVLTLTAPRTVHAVAAALVQITNTSANPAVTQDIGQAASQMVYLSCVSARSGAFGCDQYVDVPGNTPPQQFAGFTVPANRYFVITAVDVNNSDTGSSCPTPINIGMATEIGNNTLFRFGWTLAANAPTTHFTYPPGFALAPGTTIVMNNSSQTCSAEVDVYGYLTAD
jgi:hypothetical protein